MAAWLELPCTKATMNNLIEKYDKIPVREHDSEQLRQVHPENYLKKLKPDTVSKLTDRLRPALTALNYLE